MHGVFLMGGVAKQLFFERRSGSRPRMWKPAIWRYRSDLADCRAPSSPTASVCSGCLPLWLLSVNPEISTFISCSSSPLSLLFSSHLLSNLSSPVSPLPHFYWHVFVLSFHPPPWHLTMEVVAVSGFLFPFSFFFFFVGTAFVLPLPGNQKEHNFYLFRVQDMPSFLCQVQNVDLSLRLYWSVKKLRHDWIQLCVWYMLLFEIPLWTDYPSPLL